MQEWGGGLTTPRLSETTHTPLFTNTLDALSCTEPVITNVEPLVSVSLNTPSLNRARLLLSGDVEMNPGPNPGPALAQGRAAGEEHTTINAVNFWWRAGD